MVYKLVFFMTALFLNILNANILKDIQTFSADFEQTITNQSNKTIEYNGSLLISEPSSILWKYTEPVIKNVYVINNHAIIDEPELEQAIISKLEDEVDILSLLKSAQKKEENLYISNLYDTEYKLFISDEKIERIEYEDELENRVSIKFFNQEKNIEIPKDTFQFLPPDYYDIIRK